MHRNEAHTFFSEVGGLYPAAGTLRRVAGTMNTAPEAILFRERQPVRSEADIPRGNHEHHSISGRRHDPPSGRMGKGKKACRREASRGTVTFDDIGGNR